MKKLLKSIGVLILSILGGIAYRMGGSGNYPRWIRQAGECSAMTIAMWLLGLINWGIFFSFGIMWGLLTTYFKPKGTDAKWYHWTLVGLAFGISMFPWALCSHLYQKTNHWTGYGIRTLVCGFLVPIWQCILSEKACKAFGWRKDLSDEIGRGVINIATLPFLLF